MSDYSDLKAIAEACQHHQPLRFMRSHGALYIRNDNGIVFDVHQNRSFPEFMAQNKDYADLVLAANPETILALIAKIGSLHDQHDRDSGELRKLCAARDSARRERDQLRSEVAGLRTGYEAYEQVNGEMKAECARSTEREILQLAEIEALRKALESCADELSAEVICKHGGQKLEDMHPVTRRLYDRDMASVIDARAALGQGEQS